MKNHGISSAFFIHQMTLKTSCADAATICLRPLQVDNIFVFTRQVAPVPACWLFKTSPTSWPLTFDPESGVRVMCDVGYLCANYSLPRPLCSRLRPDVRDRRQTDVQRQTASSLNISALWGRRHNNPNIETNTAHKQLEINMKKFPRN